MDAELSSDEQGVGAPAVAAPDVGWPRRSRSTTYRKAMEQLVRFARHPDVTILLEGESGTGKTRLAHQLHAISPRAKAPFRHRALSAIEDGIAYSDLFGHVAGAFTDARRARAGLLISASGGTVFLDEIAKASPKVQKMLLHAVERRTVQPAGSDREVPVNVRLIVASNVSLATLRQRGEFLPDLHARLSGFRVVLPPLRERAADIPSLAQELVALHAGACQYPSPPSIDPALMEALRRAPWPDNLRELESTIIRLLIDAWPSPRLALEHCRDDLAHLAKATRPKPGSLRPADVLLAKERTGSIAGAAAALGVHRVTAHNILRRSRERDD
jgi:two-component system NtrC family response regulator/two-component system response regulator HydG/two-component system response regulator AtoC